MLLEAWKISYPVNVGEQTRQSSGKIVNKNEYWTWLYYVGTVILGMDERTFWRTQLRKLDALWEQHKRVNKLDKTEPEEEEVYIDQLF